MTNGALKLKLSNKNAWIRSNVINLMKFFKEIKVQVQELKQRACTYVHAVSSNTFMSFDSFKTL